MAKKTTRKSKDPFFKPLRASQKKFHGPLNDALVKRMEKKYGIKFPNSLTKLLKIQNGGNLLSPEFEFGKESYDLPEIPPISTDGGLEPLTRGYPDHVEAVQGELKDPHLIVPLFGDGHYFIALDYRENGPKKEPSVVYLDIENGVWQKKIADTFTKFLAGQCKPKHSPRVRVDLMDPDAEIAYCERSYEFTNPHTGKSEFAEERHWLFLTETHVERFEYENRRKRVSKGKFSKEPYTESWDRSYVALSDITSLSVTNWNALWTRRKVLDVSTSPQNMGVHYDRSQSKKGGGWKNQRGGPIIYFYFHGRPKDLANCKKKIEAAQKRKKKR